MKPIASLFMAVVVLFSMFQPVMAASSSSVSIPTFSIVSVVTDTSVTIKTYNFPAHITFTVKMGTYGTRGVGGIVVTTTDSGVGGSFVASYNIPAALKGSTMIAIRLESASSGYYAYNWFNNNSAPAPSPTPGPTPTPAPGYSGIPTFSIVSVVKDTSVTIKTKNFPAHDTFKVMMGAYGSLGIGGTVVATTDSGAGGSFTVTYSIPAGLNGSARIAIRLQSSTTGYYAYNWFYNNTAVAP
jgi:hypothetical protein